MHAGGKHGTIFMRGGVRQGCPASGVLFALALDPVMRWLANRVCTGLGTLQAYADDVGLALINIRHALIYLCPAFRIVEELIGLKLKPGKCHIVVMRAASAEGLEEWIAAYVPELLISMQAKYLGVRLGPDADSVQWSESLVKLSSAVRRFLTEQLGLVRSVVLYNRHGAPTLQFLAQVSTPSKAVVRSQSNAIQRTAYGPRCYLTDDTLMNMLQLDMPVQCTDIARYVFACCEGSCGQEV